MTSTRETLLVAAREVFGGSGFSEAAIADVVARAGASVGSLYHHFGGKSELYLALFEDYEARQEARAASAVAAARQAGEHGPVELFICGSRAYLRGCWEERDLARLFLAGGGPAGFEMVARKRYREWTRLNHTLLHLDGAEGAQEGDLPAGEALVLVLTAVVSEAGAEVSLAETEEAATLLADQVLQLMARLA
jgi:AcrR family transcriptional regulator